MIPGRCTLEVEWQYLGNVQTQPSLVDLATKSFSLVGGALGKGRGRRGRGRRGRRGRGRRRREGEGEEDEAHGGKGEVGK